jgi:hypothetical protein
MSPVGAEGVNPGVALALPGERPQTTLRWSSATCLPQGGHDLHTVQSPLDRVERRRLTPLGVRVGADAWWASRASPRVDS